MSKAARTTLGIIGFGMVLLLAALLLRRKDTPSNPGAAPVVTRQLSENRWVVSKRDRQSYLSDPSTATRQITLMPVSGEPKDSVKHLLVRTIETGSPMYTAGLRKDDIILRVNETPIGTMGRAINLVHEIRSCDRLSLKVQRGESLIDYQFDFE